MTWLRHNMKTIIWGTVIAFVVTIFAGWGMNMLGVGSRIQNIGEVNGQTISMNQFAEQLNRQRDQWRQQHQRPLRSEDQDELRQQAFKQLVNQIILQQYYSLQGGLTTSSDIRQAFAIQNRLVGPQGRINQQQIDRVLQQLPKQEREQYEEDLRSRIEQFRASSWIQNQVSLSPVESDYLVRSGLREARTYGIFVDPKSFVPEQTIQAYYERRSSQFQAPSRARIRDILLKPSSDTQASRSERLQSVSEKAKVIRRRFDAGDPFAQLAREYSQDTQTASRGGLIGWVTPEELSENVSRTAFGLETGQMSKLVPAEDGYHLVYLDSGPIRRTKPLSTVRSKIVDRLLADTHWTQARQKIQSMARQVRDASDTLSQLQELAFLESDGKTSHLSGDYGWVPHRFVLPSVQGRPDTWIGELTSGFRMDPAVSTSIFQGPAKELREPTRSEFGYHLFYVDEFRPPRLQNASDTDLQRVHRFLRQEKRAEYLSTWLSARRQEASIDLEVSRSRIGGEIPWRKED